MPEQSNSHQSSCELPGIPLPWRHAACLRGIDGASDAQDENKLFSKIGSGTCSYIFAEVQLKSPSPAMKLAKFPDSDLWNDYLMHTLIFQSMGKRPDIEVNVPEPAYFVPKDDALFWRKHPSLFDAAQDDCCPPTHVLVTERIMPLPRTTRELLIENYCPPLVRDVAVADPANQYCLVRPYLGSLWGRSGGQFFSLWNFKLHLNQMLDLQLDMERLASLMGQALAIMHWEAKTDARDVEFVLGSSRKTQPPTPSYSELAQMQRFTYTGPESRVYSGFSCRETQLWLLDFNQVKTITMDAAGVAQAIDATEANAPYYPKPLQQNPIGERIWEKFRDSYLEVAKTVLKNEDPKVRRLPLMYINGIVRLEANKMAGDGRSAVSAAR